MVGKVVDFKLVENILFIYSTKGFTNCEKVKFHYFLKGRNGGKGFLEEVKGKHLSATALLIPKRFESQTEAELKRWGIGFEKHVFYRKG